MGLRDQLILSVPVIDEKQEDEWICQEIFEKVKLHVEENLNGVISPASPTISFKLDVKPTDSKTPKSKPSSPTSPGSTSPKRSPRKLCRRCVYANCCQSNVRRKRFHGNRGRKQQVPVATKSETHEQMEKFADILLAELDVSDLDDDQTFPECFESRLSTEPEEEQTENGRKLVRSISCDETQQPRVENAVFKRRWSVSRSESPVLKQNVVSWAYEGHSAF